MGQRPIAVGRMTTDGNDDRPPLVMLAAGLAKRYGGCKPLAPVGMHGEALIDLNASDARAAGFGDIVVVVGPLTGPALSYHIAKCWPPGVPVALVEQPVALGTAHAALCASPAVGLRPFAIVNADDIYGVPALTLLAAHLHSGDGHANVTYELADTIVSADPVTRGTCTVSDDGLLRGVVERRKVSRDDRGRFRSDDGLEPAELDPSTPVSVNLWGLRPSIWPVLERAVSEMHPQVRPDGSLDGEPDNEDEVLLPEVIGRMVGAGEGEVVRAIPGGGRCIGVTHADDLPAVRSELAAMVGDGERDEVLWKP